MTKIHSSPKFLFLLVFILLGGCAGSQNTGKAQKKAEQYFAEGYQQYKLMEYEKAEALMLKAIKTYPEYAEAWEALGKMYLDQEKTAQAEDACIKALSIDPMRFYSRMDLATIYFNRQDYTACLKTLEPLKQLQAQNKQIMENLDQLWDNATFASEAIKHPVPFNPINLGDSVNTAQEEYFPGLTVDEQKLFFTRRDGSLHVYLQNEDLFYSEKRNGVWTRARNLGGPVNTPENEGAFSTSADGQYLFFTSCSRPGGYGSCDIWVSKLLGDRWSEPFNLGKKINTPNWETQPSLTSDGKTLYFTSNRPGGYGGSDIWLSHFTDTGWSEPENLGGSINTYADEQFPFIHPDNQTLYFTSEGHPGFGKADLFVSRIKDGKWTTPANLGYPINTSGDEWNVIINRTGEMAYYASDGRKDSKGGMDIYGFELYKGARPLPVSYVKGVVFDAKTLAMLQANVELLEPTTGKRIALFETNAKTGQFLATLPGNQNYLLNVSSKGYLFYSESFFLKNASGSAPFEIKVGLNKIETGEKIVSRNIFFDVNKFDLKPESEAELNKLYEFLAKNDQLKVEIGGHTDNSGTPQWNKELSENRAKSVYSYLVNKGIKADRLSYKGYGSSQPVADNATEEGKAQNRRTEFIIK